MRSMFGHYRITTERSTLPSCILWNASSMSSSPMRSETNFSSGKPALQVEVDQGGEVAFGQAIAVPRRLQRAAVREEVDQRHVQAHVGCRNTHQHNGSGQVAGVEGLLPGFGPAHRVDHHVGAEPVGEVLDGLDDVEFAGVDGVGGAELAGPVQFGVVGVDGDDLLGAHQRGPGDRGVADAAAADDGDGVVTADRAGVDRRAQPGHHSAAQQSGDCRVGGGIDFGALTRVHQRLVGERPDAQRRGQFGAVGQRHLLFGVEGVEAVGGPATLAGPALAAHGAPVQDHEVAGLDRSDARPYRFDGARGLVPEQERVFVVDAALAVVQVGVADAAGDHVDEGLAGAGVRYDDVDQLDGFALFA